MLVFLSVAGFLAGAGLLAEQPVFRLPGGIVPGQCLTGANLLSKVVEPHKGWT